MVCVDCTLSTKQIDRIRTNQNNQHFGGIDGCKSSFKDRSMFKLILLGDLDAGKSTLEKRLSGQPVDRIDYTSIFSQFQLVLNNNSQQQKTIAVWDTAGQEKFNSIPPSYYRGADFVLLVYNIVGSSKSLMSSLSIWFDSIHKYQSQETDPPNIIIIGNKLDLVNSEQGKERSITFEQAQSFANERGCQYFEISAFKGDNCQSINDYMIDYIQQKIIIEEEREEGLGK
ncbi:hypothetical protein DFA_11883 [Cavenderia fasciculata]|uniref:Rab GTPase n=1 Tax=Cavenderia fasciculata TaxID=261658 RepID=F4QEK8_CACFS|nr:uncharacterized protein DFA_11883 [Cavenderia fasciculata]EGG14119.1 hypothetical protein DFA_11883 [Cavenderia fasciculata]|eukprot:XP_004350827.1 hypothetical protein DFA_11883 [Cavenderia fasciculata]